ncbi:MAG: sodium:proton antiporter [Dehalococcoidia bacterium]|nr:sodium:proton antiporter [Dehalococcoidia bacterium]
MNLDAGTAVAVILFLGIGAEWLAWVLRLPSVLVLLAAGFIAGPVLGILNPSLMSEDTLISLVSISVAVILFEGSLSLRLSDLGGAAKIVWRLLTIGVLVTWAITSVAAVTVLGVGTEVAVLLGAILIVTGPTVIVPLLMHLRPSGRAGAILRWEGIINDPIGAVLAVLVFEGIVASPHGSAGMVVAVALLRTAVFGGALGALGALAIIVALKRYWLPDFLHSPVALAIALSVFSAADAVQSDSGLLAVTVMGLMLANQKTVHIVHIVEFKENLRVLLISVLFVVLASRVDVPVLLSVLPESLLFVGILILVARPAAVLASTIGCGASAAEKTFISWLAPRGIVAASIASLFAFRLESMGYTDARLIAPVTFIVVVATVLVYGLSAAPVARRLGIAEQRPQGILIIGADSWVQEIAHVLQEQGIRVVLVDSNWAHLSSARMTGLRAVYSSVVSQYALDELDLGGIGRLFAMSPVDEFNALAVQHFSGFFGRANVYQIAPDTDGRTRAGVSSKLTGRILFGTRWTFSAMSRLFARGATVKVTCLTEEFNFESFRRHYGDAAEGLFVVEPSGRLHVFSADSQPPIRAGHCLVSVIDPDRVAPGAAGV